MTTELEQLVFQMDVNLKKLDAKLSKSDSDVDKFARKQQAAWDKLGTSISDDLGSAIGGAASEIPLLGNALSGLSGPAAIATGALAVLAVGLNQAREAMDWADEIQRASKLSNSSAEEFQRWAIASQTVGIEQDKLADILKDVNDRVGDFLTTGGGPMADFFTKIAPKIGVTAEQFRNLSGPQALQLYVSSLEKAGVNQQEMTFFMEAMASDATALIPLLKNNGQAMGDLGAKAQSTGQILSNLTIKELAAMQLEIDAASKRIDFNLKRAFIDLAPAIVSGTNLLADFTGGVGDYSRALERARLIESAWRKGKFGADADRYADAAASLTDAEKGKGRRGGVNIEATRAYVADQERSRRLAQDLAKSNAKGGGGSKGSSAAKGPNDFTKANWDFEWQGPITDGPSGQIEPGKTYKSAAEARKELEALTMEMEKLPELYGPINDELMAIGDEIAASLGEAIVYGDDLGDAMSRTFKRIAADWATQGLEKIFHTLLSGGKGGGGAGGVVSSLFSIFNGGGIGGGLSGARANGGPVSGGKSYLVGERGPEIFTPGSNGGIATNGQLEGLLARLGRSAGPSVVVSTPLVQIAPDPNVAKAYTDSLNAKLRAVHDSAVRKAVDVNRRATPSINAGYTKLGTV